MMKFLYILCWSCASENRENSNRNIFNLRYENCWSNLEFQCMLCFRIFLKYTRIVFFQLLIMLLSKHEKWESGIPITWWGCSVTTVSTIFCSDALFIHSRSMGNWTWTLQLTFLPNMNYSNFYSAGRRM